MIRRGVVTPAFQMLCLYLIRGRRNKKCLKKASDTLKHETEITKGDWDTDRVSVTQEWQYGKFQTRICAFQFAAKIMIEVLTEGTMKEI